MRILLAVLATSAISTAATWNVRLEEATGLYRRTAEVVRVPLEKLGGNRSGFRVLSPEGKEVPHQVAGKFLLFPVDAIPGQLPLYRVQCCGQSRTLHGDSSEILVRRRGTDRVEIGNSRFRAVVDLTIPAIVEAYNRTAAPEHMVNMVENTPEDPDALATDIHTAAAKPSLPPSAIPGDNNGWTSLGGSGPMSRVQIVESGPLEGLVVLQRDGETWEFEWTAGSPVLRWKAYKGFRFAAVSATPFLPLNRFVSGTEYEWPTGPESAEPPHHEVAPRPWRKLPGGHVVYYAAQENYGALGIAALDPDLDWRDAGSRRFVAEKAAGPTEIAITFPRWRGANTVLEARREYRILRQPLLVQVVAAAVPPRRSAAGVRTGAPRTLALDGEWQLAWGEKGAGPTSEWRTVRVPGSAQTQWLPESDWYSRRAEWVSAKEWWYRKRFVVDTRLLTRPRATLEFDATDYYAEAFLNGSPIGRHEGYIDPYGLDVTGLLRAGENELRVRVWTPVTYYWRHRPYTIKGSYGAVDQKPDDITPLGITRSVRLVAGPRARISDLAVDTRLREDGGADVSINVDAEAATSHRWEATLSPRNFDSARKYTVSAPVRTGRTTLTIDVPDPHLWWTWDHGKPDLYTLEVRLLNSAGEVAAIRRLAVGIREIEERGWIFYLNRRRFFVRGTNYYYYNLYLSEMNRAAHARDMDLMLGLNINMIRLHCHFSNPEFYDLADERGVLIWQDYLEAWYPHDHDFALHAAKLYRNHVRYVRNHACVALWATSDEEDLENYADLTKHLAAIPAELDPQHRPVVRSTGRYGDAHVYHGWYEGSIWEYARMTEPFVSELGATALPNYESLIRFLPDAWPIEKHQDEWVFRKLQIPEAMRAWGKPDGLTLQQYIPRTQAYVARLFQLALERARRLKYAPAGGILHFHAIDIWPSVTMAAIDFYRQPTAVYDVVRRSFSPVLASVEYDRDAYPRGATVQMPLWLINDHWDALGKITVEWNIEGGFTAHGSVPAEIGADEVRRIGEVVFEPSMPGPFRLHLKVLRGSELLAENIVDLNCTE